jgi:hypothetical protein
MNKQVWLLAGALSLPGMMSTAAANGHGGSMRMPSTCSACHSGGPSPQVRFTLPDGSPFNGTLLLKEGQPTTLVVNIDTQPGMGIGVGAALPAELAPRSLHALANVERGILFHRTTIAHVTGRNALGVSFTASRNACARTFPVTVFAAAVNKNGSPAGDGAAQGTLRVQVECAANVAAPAVTEPRMEAKLPAAEATAEITTPGGALRSAVTLTPQKTDAPGARLSLARSDRVSLGVGLAGKHVVVDCVIRQVARVHAVIQDERGNVELDQQVDERNGHFYLVVPGVGPARTVYLRIRGEGNAGTFESCTLAPTL